MHISGYQVVMLLLFGAVCSLRLQAGESAVYRLSVEMNLCGDAVAQRMSSLDKLAFALGAN